MGQKYSKSNYNDEFLFTTKKYNLENNSAKITNSTNYSLMRSTENDKLKQSMISRTHLSQSRLSWKKMNTDLSDASSINKELSIKPILDDSALQMNNIEPISKTISDYSDIMPNNDNSIFTVEPINLEISNKWNFVSINSKEPLTTNSIFGSKISVNSLFKENVKNQSILPLIEDKFLLIRIPQEELHKIPFLENSNSICSSKLTNSQKASIINTPLKEVDCTSSYKLGLSKTDKGMKYVLFLKYSTECGWRDSNSFKYYARSLISIERKTGCEINLCDFYISYRGWEVKPLIIEGPNASFVIKCKSMLPKFIQKNLISDVQSVETEVLK